MTAKTGPNGAEDWMNCGLFNGGWSPPMLRVSDIKTVDLEWAFQQDGSPFKACTADLIGKFVYYAGQNNRKRLVIFTLPSQLMCIG